MKRRTDKSIISEAVLYLDSSPELLKNQSIIDYIALHYGRDVSKQQVQKVLGTHLNRCQKHYHPKAITTAETLLEQCNGNLEVTQQIVNNVYYTKER